jgi:hypothetical protein
MQINDNIGVIVSSIGRGSSVWLLFENRKKMHFSMFSFERVMGRSKRFPFLREYCFFNIKLSNSAIYISPYETGLEKFEISL